ncbi:MAG: bifunctional DNA-formamidopyrimidine glycosylase/DNA-(apurinic or apyrimidinic site) lyase, partial [Solirubrobacterales bacterium]
MPELPEVETVARQLDPELRGRRILRLDVLDGRWSRPVPPEELGDAVSGRTIRALGRRGKYLLLELDLEQTLVMHLRMTGNLVLVEGDRVLDPSEGRRLYEAERSTSARHLRALFALDDGRELWFTDPRRFGEAFLIDDAHLDRRFAKLGIEPFSPAFTPEALGAMAAGRTVPLKSFLLDQKGVAGVGNIYADEALFFARVHPQRPGDRLTRAQCALLAEGVRVSLEHGIASGGATIDDVRHVDGVEGWFQNDFQVHRRAGLPCPVCGTPVTKRVVGG